MNEIRDIRLSSATDASDAWAYWAVALERPDAARLVNGRNQAIVALSRLSSKDIQTDQMSEWLRKWPTPLGLEQYRHTVE